MAIRVDANGTGTCKGTHVSVFACFLEGKYDAELKWPFEGKITFTLLNQLEDDNHHQTIANITRENNLRPGGLGMGFADFIAHSALSYDPDKNTRTTHCISECQLNSLSGTGPGYSEQQVLKLCLQVQKL